MKLSSYFHRLLIFVCVSIMYSCDNSDDMDDNSVTCKPVRFEINMESEEPMTRSMNVSGKNVYISTDEGETYYEYSYSSTSGLWEAQRKYNSETSAWEATEGITWVSSAMLIYAIVRNDTQPMVKGSTITLLADQSTEANLNTSDFYGVVTQISYTTGKVSLTLKHQVGRLRVSVANCKAPNTMTCRIVQEQNTIGTITTGDDKITVTDQATPAAITMYREVTSSTTVNFHANLFTKMAFGGASKAKCLEIIDNGTTYSIPVRTTGGISIDPGYITIMNVTLK